MRIFLIGLNMKYFVLKDLCIFVFAVGCAGVALESEAATARTEDDYLNHMKAKTKEDYSTKTTDNSPYKKTTPDVKPKAPYKTTDNIHSDGKHSQNLWIEFSKAAKYMETGETFYEVDVYSEPLIDFLGEIFVRGKILNQVKDLIKQANKHVFVKTKKRKNDRAGNTEDGG